MSEDWESEEFIQTEAVRFLIHFNWVFQAKTAEVAANTKLTDDWEVNTSKEPSVQEKKSNTASTAKAPSGTKTLVKEYNVDDQPLDDKDAEKKRLERFC